MHHTIALVAPNETHDEPSSLGSTISTFWPFLVLMVIAWPIVRMMRRALRNSDENNERSFKHMAATEHLLQSILDQLKKQNGVP
jgi:large-conductance mechanosensitive channel